MGVNIRAGIKSCGRLCACGRLCDANITVRMSPTRLFIDGRCVDWAYARMSERAPLANRDMRWIVAACLLLLHACAGISLPSERLGPVTTFTLEAQGKLERCAALAGLLIPVPETTISPGTAASKETAINRCTAAAKNAVEGDYRAALNAVRLQKGTLSGVMSYYDEWEETLDQIAPVSGPAVAGTERANLIREIDELRIKANSFSGR
jgi:hypothetical protein